MYLWGHGTHNDSLGHCVLTLGTSDRENVLWGKINLLPSHCYAVIGQGLTLSLEPLA